jgi:hypothetical protein
LLYVIRSDTGGAMIKNNRVVAALAAGSALLLVIGLVLPARVLAQTPAQGQALGILLLLGLGARPGTQPPREAKKPDGVAKKAAQAEAKKPDGLAKTSAATEAKKPDGVAKKDTPAPRKPVRLASDLAKQD